MGGAAARAPVAITARRNRSVRPSTSTVVGLGEAAVAEEDVDAEVAVKRSPPSLGADAGPQPAHPLHDGGEIDLDRRPTAHAELARAPRARRRAGGADQRLGRHAADVEAVAAQEMPLDERDPGARARRRRRPTPGRPCRRR